MSEVMDKDTGEYTIGERASKFASEARRKEREMQMGVGATSLYFALFRAIEKLPEWIKAESDGHKAKYASLKNIMERVRPILLEHDIIILQGQERGFGSDEGGGQKGRIIPVFTDLIHIPTGDMRRTTVEIPLGKMDAQSLGSALTYGRRYSLLASLGLATDEADDDGQRAMPVDISGSRSDSATLIELKSSIDECGDAATLAKWDKDAKRRRSIDSLNDEERGMLRAHWSSKMAGM
jgi:hypothetical protein